MKSLDLTEKELEEIEAQAELEAEEEIKKGMKAEALEAAKARAKKKLANKEAPKAAKRGTRMVRINLGKHSDRITIDGRTFMNGREYPLTVEQEQTIRDMAFRTHLHQAELRGKNFLKDFYGRQPANAVVS
jgi:hypothetical protein